MSSAMWENWHVDELIHFSCGVTFTTSAKRFSKAAGATLLWMSSTVSQLWLGQVVAGTRTNQCRIVAIRSARAQPILSDDTQKNCQIDRFGENLHELFCCMCPLQEKPFRASDANMPADFDRVRSSARCLGGVAAKARRLVERTTLQSPRRGPSELPSGV